MPDTIWSPQVSPSEVEVEVYRQYRELARNEDRLLSERLLIFLTARSILFAGLRQHDPHDFGNPERARYKKRVYLGSKFRKTKSIYKTLKGGVQNG